MYWKIINSNTSCKLRHYNEGVWECCHAKNRSDKCKEDECPMKKQNCNNIGVLLQKKGEGNEYQRL